MTTLAVRCIPGGDMDQNEWTEQQLIAFAHEHGYRVTSRQLKRYRQEGVLPSPQIIHLGFGPGTASVYPKDAGQLLLAICRLLSHTRGRNFSAVRFGLWLEGHPVDIGLLKESLWYLVPFSSWKIPETRRERETKARGLTRKILRAAWKSTRGNLTRTILTQFDSEEDRYWFVNIHTQLLYGVPVDFTRDLLGEHDPSLRGTLEEPADVFAHGLALSQV